jgi:hypothetical protein
MILKKCPDAPEKYAEIKLDQSNLNKKAGAS